MMQQLTHDPELPYVRKVKSAQCWHAVIHSAGLITEKANDKRQELKNSVFLACSTIKPGRCSSKGNYELKPSKYSLAPAPPYNVSLCF